MKRYKKVLAIFSFSMFMLFNHSKAYANIFNDVTKDNVAYSSIEKMYNLKIMLGDLQGNFKPNSHISKFEAMKILSNFINKDIDLLNSKYNNVVSQYDNKYSRWDSSSNIAIILLLENNILKEEELKDFIVIDKNNKEQIRALSKEEIALFLTRIDNNNNVDKMSFNKIFNDEKDIDKNKLNACYYMDSLGIVTSKDNNFYPKQAVTKAELAVMLDKFLDYSKINIGYNESKIIDTNKNIQTRIVTIKNTFVENKSIQIQIDNETKIYPLDKSVKIYIDEKLSSILDITPNINGEITIQDGFITKIDIKSNLKIKDNKNLKEEKFYGTIKSFSKDSIGLYYKENDEDGFYNKPKIEIFPLSKDLKIIKNGINISNLEENSLATIILENKMVKEIILEDENTMFVGHIIERDKDNITIKTIDNKIFELNFLENAKITRNNQPSNILSLKIGDSIYLNAKKDKIINLDAKGTIYKKEGIIKSIEINNNYSIISVLDEKNNTKNYYVNNFITDIYSIKVLDKVSLYLDSDEVTAIKILDRKNNKSFSGEVKNISNNYITVYTKTLTNEFTTQILIDKNTIFFDYENFNFVSFKDLKKGDKVYIVLNNPSNKTASNINIVSK